MACLNLDPQPTCTWHLPILDSASSRNADTVLPPSCYLSSIMLATPSNMQGYSNNHFGERTVTDLESIIDDPTSLLFKAAPNVRQQHVPEAGAGLEILSASQYPHPFLSQNRPSSNKRKDAPTQALSQQFYGGIVLDKGGSAPSVSSSESLQASEPPRPRKKAKKAVIQDDSGQEDATKRSRGRPRLDTQDETAADRRRTQIRLAQRAYRHRKETTITGLKQRVTGLQATIEQMNVAFLALHDNLMDSGLFSGHRGLTTHLEDVMSQFDQLARDAAVDEDEDEAPPAAKSTKKNAKPNSKAEQKAAQSQSPMQSNQGSDIEELPPVSLARGDSPLYATYEDAPWGNDSEVMQFHVHLPEAQVDLEAITHKDNSAFSKAVPRSLTSAVPSSGGFYTYSFQETTFARRLQRLSLERAFRHLTSPSTNPAYLARAFRFTFCFSNRRRMLERFQAMLKRKAGEALENFNVPFYQIGGAGTHFPRRDENGRVVVPPNMLGPERAVTAPGLGVSAELWGLQMSFADTPRKEGSVQEMLEQLGYGGYWLDSHDVDEYLKSKGIFLDGTSSFTEVDPLSLTLDSELPNTNMTPSSGQSSPLRTPSPLDLPATVNLAFPIDQPFTQQPLDDMFNSMLNTDNDPDFALQTFLASTEKDFRAQPHSQQLADIQSTQIWPWQEPAPTFSGDTTTNHLVNTDMFATVPSYSTTGNTKAPINYGHSAISAIARDGMDGARAAVDRLVRNGNPVTIDVERLLERLVDGGACLGRAPGFRKELVDHAVVMSLAEAF